MYSMVLMMAVTAAPETAACHNEYSCTGCYGAPVVSCCATPVAYTSCTGCTGCHGGSLLFGGYSCSGAAHYKSCGCGLFKHGCTGCSGCYGCTGCTGYSCTGYTCTGCYGTIATPVAPPATKPPETVPPPKKEMPSEPKKVSLPATITVNVPADAKILIDGAPTTSTEAVRVFSTPTLEAGAVYYYTFTAEVVRSGKTFTAVEKVAVEAGSTPTISLNPIADPSVASK